jgi:DNA-binding CsgD family transcriptional regulator
VANAKKRDAGSRGASEAVLTALFQSPIVGCGFFDTQLRYLRLNPALAATNRLPASAHLGRRPRNTLGAVGRQVETWMEEALDTGKPVLNRKLSGRLPTRAGTAHWVVSYVPVRSAEGQKTELAAVVLEVTRRRATESAINHLIGNLLHAEAVLRTEIYSRRGEKDCWPDERTGMLTRALELVDACVMEAQSIVDEQPVLTIEAPEAVGGASVSWTRNANGASRKWLSEREREIVRQLAESKSNKEVASALGISVRTAETHRARIMMKLELRSLSDLVRYAVRNRIIEA